MTAFSKTALIAVAIFALGTINPAAAKSGNSSHGAATTTTSQTGHDKNVNAAKGNSKYKNVGLGIRKSGGGGGYTGYAPQR